MTLKDIEIFEVWMKHQCKSKENLDLFHNYRKDLKKKYINFTLDEIEYDIKCLFWKETLQSQLNEEKEFEKRLYNLLNDILTRIKMEKK